MSRSHKPRKAEDPITVEVSRGLEIYRRGFDDSNSPPSPKPKKRKPTRKVSNFVQRNVVQSKYHLVLKPTVSASILSNIQLNPEFIIKWDDISYVLSHMSSDDLPFCPICHDTLLVPKISPCGHIFCAACISGYFTHCVQQEDTPTSKLSNSIINGIYIILFF